MIKKEDRVPPFPHFTIMGVESLEINRRGRLIFLLGVGLLVAMMVVMGVLVVRGLEASQRWIPIAILCTVALSALWIMLIVLVRRIYRLRILNVTLLVLCGVAVGGLMAASLQFTTHYLMLSIGSVSIFLQVAMGSVLAWRGDSAIAHRVHPWVAFDDDYEAEAARRLKQRPSVGDLRDDNTSTTEGRRKVHLRKISVFQDWPAPQPFTAQAIYNYRAGSSSELSLRKGEQITILDCRGNWWQAKDPQTNTLGFVPSNYVAVLQRLRVRKSHQAQHDDEVDVREGETVECMERHEEGCLIRNVKGNIGSIPTECLE